MKVLFVVSFYDFLPAEVNSRHFARLVCLNINLIDYAILNIYKKSTVMITEVLIYTEGKRKFLYEETRQKFCLKKLYKDHN